MYVCMNWLSISPSHCYICNVKIDLITLLCIPYSAFDCQPNALKYYMWLSLYTAIIPQSATFITQWHNHSMTACISLYPVLYMASGMSKRMSPFLDWIMSDHSRADNGDKMIRKTNANSETTRFKIKSNGQVTHIVTKTHANSF